MVDKAGLQFIGWVFGGAFGGVLMIAAVLVGQAAAEGNPQRADHGAYSLSAGPH
jgi:hypothetical protein